MQHQQFAVPEPRGVLPCATSQCAEFSFCVNTGNYICQNLLSLPKEGRKQRGIVPNVNLSVLLTLHHYSLLSFHFFEEVQIIFK